MPQSFRPNGTPPVLDPTVRTDSFLHYRAAQACLGLVLFRGLCPGEQVLDEAIFRHGYRTSTLVVSADAISNKDTFP